VPPPGQPPLLRAVRQSLSIYARRARALARLSGDVVAISSRRAALDDDAVIAGSCSPSGITASKVPLWKPCDCALMTPTVCAAGFVGTKVAARS
jgi:hypothetical protein